MRNQKMQSRTGPQEKFHAGHLIWAVGLASWAVTANSTAIWAAPNSSADVSPVTATPAASPSQPQPGPQQVQAAGVQFTAPAGFSAIQPLGGETLGIVYPATALQTQQVSVRLAEINADVIGMSMLSPADLAEYARFNFFGITSPPQQTQTRQFLGQPVTGAVMMQASRSGGTRYVEFYLVPLSNQRQLAIAFEADTELPIALFEQTVETVTTSLQELPGKKKRR